MKAFTLIDLLVTLAIVSLLVGILLTSLAGARAAAQLSACHSNLRQLQIGARADAAMTGELPTERPALRCPADRTGSDDSYEGLSWSVSQREALRTLESKPRMVFFSEAKPNHAARWGITFGGEIVELVATGDAQ